MRPIDANTLFDFLTDQLDKETGAYSKGRNAGINIARSALHDETITPTIAQPPTTLLTLEELRGMDGEPVYDVDGECYIVNAQREYAVDKHRGFRMLWEDGFFFRRRHKEDAHGMD